MIACLSLAARAAASSNTCARRRVTCCRVRRRGETAREVRLDQSPRLEHRARLFHRGTAHEGAAIGNHRDDGVVREPRERLPDLGPADVENRGQALLDELRSRRKLMRKDRAQDSLDDRVDAQRTSLAAVRRVAAEPSRACAAGHPSAIGLRSRDRGSFIRRIVYNRDRRFVASVAGFLRPRKRAHIVIRSIWLIKQSVLDRLDTKWRNDRMHFRRPITISFSRDLFSAPARGRVFER